MNPTKILVAQGGGPTAVINQSLAGVVLQARRLAPQAAVLGAWYGVHGIVDQALVDLGQETEADLLAVAATPGAALGATRDDPDAAYCREIVRVCRAHGIGTFFYIGGNGSSATVKLLADVAQQMSYPLACLHVPKTIDNDLAGSDHSPGYGSAARFVAQAFAGVEQDNRSLPGVYVGVVMGREAGFLTAASALGRTRPDDGPHLIYLPERPFELASFLADVKAVYDRLGRCTVAVSEGIRLADGSLVATHLAQPVTHDPHGNVQLSGSGALADLLCGAIRGQLGIQRVRGDTFGYLQRSFLGCMSEVDQREAREAGAAAVHHALGDGARRGSVAIRRLGDEPYCVDYPLIDLAIVGGQTRLMDEAFIAASGTDVTDAFCTYLRPLIGSSLPPVQRLRAVPVPPVTVV